MEFAAARGRGMPQLQLRWNKRREYLPPPGIVQGRVLVFKPSPGGPKKTSMRRSFVGTKIGRRGEVFCMRMDLHDCF